MKRKEFGRVKNGRFELEWVVFVGRVRRRGR